jgi:dihydroneopterin aldolase
MDTIRIQDLEVHYCVGVPANERANPQKLLVTVEMAVDFTRAAKTDDLACTVDYAAVSERLKHFGEGRSWKLLETLAVELAQGIHQEFRPLSVTVEIKKFIIAEARHVAVRLTRPE